MKRVPLLIVLDHISGEQETFLGILYVEGVSLQCDIHLSDGDGLSLEVTLCEDKLCSFIMGRITFSMSLNVYLRFLNLYFK